jgi:AAA family ATP:ADP antiporter
MLFSRMDTETKYKAKNAIDVPVYRGGDALIAQVDSRLDGAGMSPQNIALIGAGAAVLWAVNGVLLGRSGTKRGEEASSGAPEAAPARG